MGWRKIIKSLITNRITSLKKYASDRKKKKIIANQIAVDNIKVNQSSNHIWYYLAGFVVLIFLVAQNYVSTSASTDNKTVADIKTAVNVPEVLNNQVNDVSSANLASNLAQSAQLPIAQNVAIKTAAQVDQEVQKVAVATVLDKPSIISTDAASKSIIRYKVQAGDSVKSIANANNISEQTVRWANRLKKTEDVKPGMEISILPINGITYKVNTEDTIDSIVSKYKSNRQRFVTFNDLELSGLKPGTEIIIPDGILPEKDRPDYVAPVQIASSSYNTGYYSYSSYVTSGVRSSITPMGSIYASQMYGGKGYPGQCTWYAGYRRAQLGNPIPNAIFGNGGQWAYSARANGMSVGRTPAAGAVFVMSPSVAGVYTGHVGVVEQVYDNGDIYVTEMNVRGTYQVNSARIPAKYTSMLEYIY